MPASFSEHFREIARRFLLTAVVVDDELSVARDTPVHGDLTPPGRRERKRPRKSMDLEADAPRPLDVDPITWSFARQGMVCGVPLPTRGRTGATRARSGQSSGARRHTDSRLETRSGERGGRPAVVARNPEGRPAPPTPAGRILHRGTGPGSDPRQDSGKPKRSRFALSDGVRQRRRRRCDRPSDPAGSWCTANPVPVPAT